MGGFLKYLGFALPLAIAIDGIGSDPKNPPRDRLPGKGLCSFCKRERAVSYALGMFERMCKVCLDDTLRVRFKRGSNRRRLLPEHPLEAVVENPDDEFARRRVQWDRWLG